ncbi:MAG: GT-D fold domain-containing glycosyltransferase [Clostridia bacterium]|nr:GT-D fold domain-containing glycosyltransferase [Clostridia bacterium]
MKIGNKLKFMILAPHSWRLSKKYQKLNVLSDDETLDRILATGCSVARFGDGEMNIMRGVGIKFQKADDRLKERLLQIAAVGSNENVLVCVPNIFDKEHIDTMTHEAKKWWKNYLRCTRGYWHKLFRGDIFGDTNISRFYMESKNKDRAGYVSRLKSLWADKRLLIVEGMKSRLGMGNDLFADTQSIKRILCPSSDAFGMYDKILNNVNAQIGTGDFDMMICALGPTATVLCSDTADKIQSLDLGHIDVEYEWFLQKANTKCAIENKSVTEVVNDCGDETDSSYREQIIGVIE